METDTWENFPRAGADLMSAEDGAYQDYYREGPKRYKGAPVPLQLIGRRFGEEKLLSILERVVNDLESAGVS
jgi:hypothetical protein